MRRRMMVLLALILAIGLTLSACDLNAGDDETDVAGTPEAATTEEIETPENDTADAPAVARPSDNATPEGTPGAQANGDLTHAIRDVSRIIRPTVAFIAIQAGGTGAPGAPGQQGVGSGVVFDERGYILTNNHVVENAEEMMVVLPDDPTSYRATLVGRSPSLDLAVIQIEGEDLPVATLGDSNELEIGEWVVAIGNALGLPGGPTVTAGVVSALDRTIEAGQQQVSMEDLIQIDAAINPGNSGGPLVNLRGEVVGINTAAIQGAEGIGFAVSMDTAQRFIDEVLTGDPRPFLGITGGTLTAAVVERFDLAVDSGVLVIQVQADSPAQEAGIQPGDVIVAFDGKSIASTGELQETLDEYSPGDEVTVTINREGQEQELTVIIGESMIIR